MIAADKRHKFRTRCKKIDFFISPILEKAFFGKMLHLLKELDQKLIFIFQGLLVQLPKNASLFVHQGPSNKNPWLG